jgi:hypothetical protein
MPQFLQRGFKGPRVQCPFDHLAVLAGDGGEDTHAYVRSDPRRWVTRMGLDGALDENPESDYQPGPAAGDSGGEDAGSAFGDQSLQAAGVLVDPDGADPGEGHMPAVGFDPDRAGGEGDPVMPTSDETAELSLLPGVPVVRVLRTVYDSEGRSVEVQDSVVAADRHEFRYEEQMR